MGVMSALATLGGLIRPATDLTRTLRGDRAASNEMDHNWRTAVLGQLAAEFAQTSVSPFDRFVNALNRLPRPALALGTLGLFIYAMVDPVSFASRMQGLALVPEPLWWLLGAIVSFYFGARELHYLRHTRPRIDLQDLVTVTQTQDAMEDLRPETARFEGGFWNWPSRRQIGAQGDPVDPNHNAAVEAWKSSGKSA